MNVSVVRATADSGRLSLVGPSGEVLAEADAHGPVALHLRPSLVAGATYTLAVDGIPDPEQAFTAASCKRSSVPALQGGAAAVTVRDTAVQADLVLDWPTHVTVQVNDMHASAFTAETDVLCAPPACGPQSFVCAASLRLDGLAPATDYTLRVIAQDDFGRTLRTTPQPFSTVAALPRAMLTEVMTSGTAGEYVEVFNPGPGAADLAVLALAGDDGVLRPLVAVAPPLPLLLNPGGRALAVGASFDASLYPGLPAATPVLRTSTQRLLGHGLSDATPPAIRLVSVGDVPVELSEYPGGGPHCSPGVSLQRDESVPPDAAANWACGIPGGTPGAPP
jgi:hypothetical protein